MNVPISFGIKGQQRVKDLMDDLSLLLWLFRYFESSVRYSLRINSHGTCRCSYTFQKFLRWSSDRTSRYCRTCGTNRRYGASL